MKQVTQRTLLLAAACAATLWNATAFAQFGEGVSEQKSTLIIRSDGTCRIESDSAQNRAVIEGYMRAWKRYYNQDGDDESPFEQEDSDEDVALEESPAPYKDEDLAQDIRASYSNRQDQVAADSAPDVTVTVEKDIVRVHSVYSFPSLEELLTGAYGAWFFRSAMFDNARFEKDSDGHLLVTLTPSKSVKRYAKGLRLQGKLEGAKTEIRIVFPGTVLSSGLPGAKDNETGFAWDGRDDASIDALMELYKAPIVIKAELGGLKFDQPLETKFARRRSGLIANIDSDLPLTNAMPGYVAEPMSISTTVMHLFPEGRKRMENADEVYSYLQTGTVVTARLFAPKGRNLISVSDLRVVKAVDDQGRPIPTDDSVSPDSNYGSFGSRIDDSRQFQLRLALPRADAQSIDQVDVEVTAVTAGSWKETTLTNIEANTTNEISLAEVLPGSSLVITKIQVKDSHVRVQGRIKGPKAVQRLSVQVKIPGNESQGDDATPGQAVSDKTGSFNRSISLDAYSYGEHAITSEKDVSLSISFPEDLRREQLTFTLSGLDLL